MFRVFSRNDQCFYLSYMIWVYLCFCREWSCFFVFPLTSAWTTGVSGSTPSWPGLIHLSHLKSKSDSFILPPSSSFLSPLPLSSKVSNLLYTMVSPKCLAILAHKWSTSCSGNLNYLGLFIHLQLEKICHNFFYQSWQCTDKITRCSSCSASVEKRSCGGFQAQCRAQLFMAMIVSRQ